MFGRDLKRLEKISGELNKLSYGVIAFEAMPAEAGRPACIRGTLFDRDPKFSCLFTLSFQGQALIATVVGITLPILRRPAPLATKMHTDDRIALMVIEYVADVCLEAYDRSADHEQLLWRQKQRKLAREDLKTLLIRMDLAGVRMPPNYWAPTLD